MSNESYDGSIQSLLSTCEQDWGDPLKNRAGLVPYGDEYLDKALYGIDVVMGEVLLVIGQEKMRKTSWFRNIIANYMLAEQLKTKPVTMIDMLESGDPPKKVRDWFICNIASRLLLQIGHKPRAACPICKESRCKQLTLKPKYLRYNTLTPEQIAVRDAARQVLNTWPLYIFGPSLKQGDTRNIEASEKRWRSLIKDKGAKILGVDHVQQYSFGNAFTSDYEKQVRSIALISDVVAQENVAFFVLSQVSLTSVRDARQGSGRIMAAGGQKGTQEANTEFTLKYENGSGIIFVEVTAAREAGNLRLSIPIDDVSGAFCGKSVLREK